MYKYFLQRLKRRTSVYFALLLGCLITFPQIQEVLGYQDKMSLSLYSHWFESLTGSPFPGVYWMLFPIVVAMPLSTMVREDKKQNYFYLIQLKGKTTECLNKVFKLNFVVGGVTGILPIVLNIISIAMILPAIKLNLVADGDGNITLNHMSLTLFPTLYYDHPLIHTSIYLFIGFMVGGMLATMAFVISLWSKKSFFALTGVFLLIYSIRFILSENLRHFFSSIIPTDYTNQISQVHGLNLMLILISYTIFAALTLIAFKKGKVKFIYEE